LIQQALAKDITVRVHSEGDHTQAIQASKILFGQSTEEELRSLSNKDFEEIFEGVPTKKINRAVLRDGIDVMKLFVDETSFFPF
jgi:tyrosyl-tRNA synthetase